VNSDLSDDEVQKLFDQELEKLKEEEERKKYKDWKPGYRKRPLLMSYNLEDFDENIKKWRPQLDKRTGALGIKIGMMPVWDEWGERHACTALFLDNNVVLRTFKEQEDGYTAVQIGAGERKAKNVTKALMGHYHKFNVDQTPPYIVREFRVSHEEYLPSPGTKIQAAHFVPGQNVDIAANTKGKGFQGGMKRWNFSGLGASHGVSASHRSIGSTGSCQDPGRVFKGKKMPGRLGNERVTIQNLRVVKIDRGRNVLYVKGAVPGQKGEFVEIRDSVKKPLFGTEKVLGGSESYVFPPLPTFQYEEDVDGSMKSGLELMMPMSNIDPFAPIQEEPL
jgi:large subunit ribosomal protein L3